MFSRDIDDYCMNQIRSGKKIISEHKHWPNSSYICRFEFLVEISGKHEKVGSHQRPVFGVQYSVFSIRYSAFGKSNQQPATLSYKMKKAVPPANIYFVLLYRILIVMLLLTVSRIGFYVFNIRMFPDIPFGQFAGILKGGLLFDISAAVYVNLLFLFFNLLPFDFRYTNVYQKIMKYLFFITNGFALAANGADYVYYRFVMKRATADIFGTFENENNLARLIFRFMLDYWPVTIFTLLLIFAMIFLYNRLNPVKPKMKNRILYHSLNFLLVPVFAGLIVIAARGGYKHSTRPITISNAARYVENPRDVAIVLNTPFSLIRTSGKKTLVKYEFFDELTLKGIYDPHKISKPDVPFRHDNVVILILESFAREYIGSLNTDLDNGNYRGYTPFLDSLIRNSLTFEVSLANGKKSIDAMPSILASLPSLETPYTISHYANNSINGLPGLLKEKGYYSAFFHGAPNGSMGFDSFARMAGFDDYFGLNEYSGYDDFDGMWGVWDEPFLDFFNDKLRSFPEPFFASVFTISSHHPFKVPGKYEGKFPKGPAPIIEVIGYSDYALRQFFNKARKESWFGNTLFVITADHTNESVRKEFQNNFGSFSVPVIFYKSGSDLQGVKNRIAQQIDIMPSVLSYLNYEGEYIAFGNNLFDDSEESFAFNTSASTYQLFMKDHMLEMIDNKTVGLYNYKTDRLLQYNITGTDNVLQSELEEKLKAVIQSYNSRLIDNNLVVKHAGNQ